MRRGALTALLGAALLAVACGGDEGSSGGAGGRPELTVSAAASLKKALTAYAEDFDDAKVRLSFAGSDELAAQIRQGVTPDVFASANVTLPEALAGEGLVEAPVTFTGNRLVIAVPAEGGRKAITRLEDLAGPGVRIAAGAESVPVGAYTRKVLDRLPDGQRRGIVLNIRSNEPDVGGVVGKLTQGAVDAGFVYVTDVKATAGKLRAIELPANLQPSVAYAAAVVKGAGEPAVARRFLEGLVAGAGQDALREAGFEPPPK